MDTDLHLSPLLHVQMRLVVEVQEEAGSRLRWTHKHTEEDEGVQWSKQTSCLSSVAHAQ